MVVRVVCCDAIVPASFGSSKITEYGFLCLIAAVRNQGTIFEHAAIQMGFQISITSLQMDEDIPRTFKNSDFPLTLTQPFVVSGYTMAWSTSIQDPSGC